MLRYKESLVRKGITIETGNHNIDLFNVLESLYDGLDDIDLFDYLRVIYSELSDEVDDEDYYDMGYDKDCDDLADVLHDYCLKYEVDRKLLAVNVGRYLIQLDDRQFRTFEYYHQVLAKCLYKSTDKGTVDSHILLSIRLNAIVNEDIENKYSDVPILDDYDN